jgi:hypothetical protein
MGGSMNSTTGKSDRLLQIYSRLVNGEVLSKKEIISLSAAFSETWKL